MAAVNRWGGGQGGLTHVWLDRRGDKPPACHLPPPPPLVLLHRVLGGTDGAGSGVPPQCPPFPKPAWALAAYARAQEDLVGEVGGGVTCLWVQDAHVGGHGAVLGVQELVPALTVRQDACLQHPLPPAWFRPPVAALPPPPYWGASCLSSPPSAPP